MDCPNCVKTHGAEVEMLKEDMSGVGQYRGRECTSVRIEYTCPACDSVFVFTGKGRGLQEKT
jgi:hypothetical protein